MFLRFLADAFIGTLDPQLYPHLPLCILHLRASGSSGSCSIAAGYKESVRYCQRYPRNLRLCRNHRFRYRIRFPRRQDGLELGILRSCPIRLYRMSRHRDTLESSGRRICESRKGTQRDGIISISYTKKGWESDMIPSLFYILQVKPQSMLG